MSHNRKLFVATPPRQTLSRHKIFCHDINGSALGKLCRDTRRPLSRPNTLSQPQTLSRHKISVATWGQKSLSRPKPLSMPGNPVATRRSLSRHRARKLYRKHALSCREHALRCRSRACLSCAPRPSCARPGQVVRLT